MRLHGRDLSPRARCADPGSTRSPRALYEVAARSWWLYWPCETCGGSKLPLGRGDSLGEGASGGAQSMRAFQDRRDRRCPGCETRARRLERPGEEPAVWYDTLVGGWVLRLPVDDSGDAAVLPLEIRSFAAPLAVVYRAAADVVYCAEELDDMPAGDVAEKLDDISSGHRADRDS